MKGTNPNDDDLLGWIKEAMRDNPYLSSHAVNVGARRGVVTLRGTVQSHRRKLLAQEIAASTEGCRDVVNEIEVMPPGSVADAEIANHVRAVLGAHADIDKATITVAANRGKVSLTGAVGSHWESELAGDLALSAKGVRSVRNHLIVDLPTQMEDAALSRRIETEFTRVKGLKGAAIRCAVAAGVAVLSGHVSTMDQKEVAGKVASRFGVRAVRNEIAIVES